MMKTLPPVHRWQRGFTLIELVVVMVLLGILAVVGANMLSDGFTSTQLLNEGSAREAEARYAMERLTRELRQVQYVSGSGYKISPAVNGTSFTKVIAASGASSTSTVVITYDPSADTVSLGDGASNSVLVNNVANGGFMLSYLDATASNALPAASAASASFVQLDLTVNTSPTGTRNFAQSTRIGLRNQ